MLSRSSRVVGRCFVARGFDFAGLAKKVNSSAAKGDLAMLREAVDDAKSEAKLAAKPVAPIDWASYKAKIQDKGVVDRLEKIYNSLEYPTYEGPEKETLAQFETFKAEAFKLATEAKQNSVDRVTELEGILAELKANRTTKDTYVNDYLARHPEIDQEIQKEIKEEKWLENI